jgi:hypothetical protein
MKNPNPSLADSILQDLSMHDKTGKPENPPVEKISH